jgi:hypothetical protein
MSLPVTLKMCYSTTFNRGLQQDLGMYIYVSFGDDIFYISVFEC